MDIKPYGQIRARLFLVSLLTGLTVWGLLLTDSPLIFEYPNPSVFSIVITTLGSLALWLVFVDWIIPYAAGRVVRAPNNHREKMYISSLDGIMQLDAGEKYRPIDNSSEMYFLLDITPHATAKPYEVCFAITQGRLVRAKIEATSTITNGIDFIKAFGLRAKCQKQVTHELVVVALRPVASKLNEELRAGKNYNAATVGDRLKELLVENTSDLSEKGINVRWEVTLRYEPPIC